jgi:leucyl/phenylalanyl-tRNA--protein transferase
MPLHVLTEKLWFPPAEDAMSDGLLAMGGDLSIERLLLAYRNGIFPWYDNDLPLWWHPNPRFILFPNELIVSKSMKQLIKQKAFHFTTNTAFEAVINNCKTISRKDQDGTWINEDIKKAYCALHKIGIAHSAEVWSNGKLVGGLYGIRLGKIFFGESMFSNQSNASKYAFIQYVEILKKEGVVLIDCQVYTSHLESLGAKMIGRNEFMEILKTNI